jgi:hypothetical protein
MNKSLLEPLIEKGLGIRPIAKQLGTSPSNIRYWVVKHGLKLKQKSFSSGYRHPKPTYCCGQCGETQREKFYGNKKKTCGRCHNAYNLKLGQQKRLRAIQELGGCCQVCGFSEYSCSLDIHHLDPTSKAPNFHALRGWSWERIVSELKKCVLLCKNCHSAIHAGFLQL